MNFIVPDVMTSAVAGALFTVCALAALYVMVEKVLEWELLQQGVYNKSRYSCLEEAQDMAFSEACQMLGVVLSIFGVYLLLSALNLDAMHGGFTLGVRP